MTLGIGKHMTDAEILAQAASAWDELERTLVERCKLKQGDELEAARAGCICILVDAIRGERQVNVRATIEDLEDKRNVENLGALLKPVPKGVKAFKLDDDPRAIHNAIADAVGESKEYARWNKMLDDAINGIRE